MSDALEREIAELPKLKIDQLQAKWRARLKEPPPLHVRKQLFVPILAYKLQEQAYGGLKPEVRRQLEKIAASYRGKSKGESKEVNVRACKPGTRLLRQWNGETHQVMVAEKGFEYRGEHFKSLSVIARRITGTRWSGPAFFGLKVQKK